MSTALELIAVEVRADINQLEQQMTGATRVVDQNYQRITQAAQSSERAIVKSSANASDAIDGTAQRTRLLGQQFSQVGQQIAAGTGPLQALAIQLPDIALAFQSTGAAAGGLASFLGGPWGIALTTAAAVAASFIPEILGIGDAADDARPKIDGMTASLDALRKAAGRATQEQLGFARADVFVKEAAVRRLESVSKNVTLGTAAGLPKIQQNLANARLELQDAQRLLSVSELVSKRISDAAAKADGAASAPTSGGGRSRPRRSGTSATEREAEQAAKQAVRLDQQYERTKAQLELEQRLADLRSQGNESASMLADMLEARFRLEQQFPELAKSTKAEDQQRLQVLLDIQGAIIGEAYQRKAVKDAAEEQRKEAEKDMRRAERDIDNIQRQQERQVRTLAGLYQDAFRGGTEAIWGNFKEIGLSVIAEVVARFTLAKISGGAFDLGGAIGAAVSSTLPGFASGGSLVIGGRGGTDNNVLALNGRPVARVSQGEHLNITNPALARGSAGQTVIHAPQFNMSGALVTAELYADMQRISNESAAAASGAAYRRSMKDAPTAVNRARRYGR